MQAFSRCFLPVLFAIPMLAGVDTLASAADDPLKIVPDNATICAGTSASFLVNKKAAAGETTTWSIDPPGQGSVSGGDNDGAKYKAPDAVGSTAMAGVVILTATRKSGAKEEKAIATLTLPGLCQARYGGDVVRATLGFAQIGAAGTDSDQKYSFDMFITRPLPIFTRSSRMTGSKSNDYVPPITDEEYYFGPRFRWWGDVRVASYPQQITSEAATFAKGFATNAAKVQVNKLVQSAEFEVGLEARIGQFTTARDSATEPVRTRYALMAFAGAGSIGPFPPGDDPVVFTVPDAPSGTASPSPQYAEFHKRYPDIASKYVAFRPLDRHQFSRQWDVGVRLYTFFADDSAASHPLAKAPAIVEVGIGENALVSPKHATWRASAYYPFALGDRRKSDTLIIYFFGDVNMRLRTDANAQGPLYLLPAVDADKAPIPVTNANITFVDTVPNQRDMYRVGVSVDLLRIWDKLVSTK